MNNGGLPGLLKYGGRAASLMVLAVLHSCPIRAHSGLHFPGWHELVLSR